MNIAFARNEYKQTKVTRSAPTNDGYEAVKFALEQIILSMQTLQTTNNPETKEHHFERALSSIYFLQKCLDFEKGGELAVNLFKVYEYCRKQVLQVTKLDSGVKLDDAVLFIKTILEGWDGIKEQSTNSTHFLDNVYD